MRTGELAAQAGVNIQTVRLYERLGLITPPKRLRSGYRDYPTSAIGLIRVIKHAQQLGFTLKEINSLVHLREKGGYTREEMQRLARAKLEHLDREISRLTAMRDSVQHGLSNCKCSDEFPMCLFAGSAGSRASPRKPRRES